MPGAASTSSKCSAMFRRRSAASAIRRRRARRSDRVVPGSGPAIPESAQYSVRLNVPSSWPGGSRCSRRAARRHVEKPTDRRSDAAVDGPVPAGAVHERGSCRVELAEAVEQRRERQVDRILDAADEALVRVAHVDDLQSRGSSACQALSSAAVMRGAWAASSGRSASCVVMSGSAPITWSKPMRASRTRASRSSPGSVTRMTDLARAQDVAGVLGEPAVEADVDRPAQVPGRELVRGPGVDHDGTVGLLARPTRSRSNSGGVVGLVEQVALLAVRVGGEREVERRDRLALRDGVDELVLGHGCERVVGRTLLADRRARCRRQVLAARRAGTVRGVDTGGVGQGEELLVHRVVELAGEVVGR